MVCYFKLESEYQRETINRQSLILLQYVNTCDVGDFLGHATGLRYNPLVNFPARSRVERFNVW